MTQLGANASTSVMFTYIISVTIPISFEILHKTDWNGAVVDTGISRGTINPLLQFKKLISCFFALMLSLPEEKKYGSAKKRK